jgi:hypothetical protein
MSGRRPEQNDEDRKSRYNVRHNVGDFATIRLRRSATKHRVSQARSLYVVEHAAWILELGPPPRRTASDPRLLFLGDDSHGVALEVIGVEPADRELLVIHAMPLRQRYRETYEEMKAWPRSDIR